MHMMQALKKYNSTSAVSVTFKKRNRGILVKQKNLYRDILDAISGFGINAFSDTSHMLSICTFKLFCTITGTFPYFQHAVIVHFSAINVDTSTASNVDSFFGNSNESKNRYRYRYRSIY